MKKLSVMVPVYNEEKTVEELLKKVLNVNLSKYDVTKEIIVVDDGSKDRSAEIVENLAKKHKEIRLIRKQNGGKGSAIKEAIKNSTGDILIVQDADLEYDPNDYGKLIKPILDGTTKVVYGSRFLEKQQKKQCREPLFKGKHKKAYVAFYLGGRAVTNFTNLLFFSNITDEPTCYKVFDAEFARSLNIKGNKFEWEPEVTAKILKRGHKILEISINYHPRSIKEGKKINWKDGVQALWTLLKYRFIG